MQLWRTYPWEGEESLCIGSWLAQLRAWELTEKQLESGGVIIYILYDRCWNLIEAGSYHSTFQEGNRRSILWEIWPAQEEKSRDNNSGNSLQTAQWDHSSVTLKPARPHDCTQSFYSAFIPSGGYPRINRYLRKASNTKEWQKQKNEETNREK